ncbi:MAG: acyloxyacyl hydrolase [Flavobacteriaceae bacterium]|nr:acyloxyacyl hydrolase [Flavobacteriaceae bacterium]
MKINIGTLLLLCFSLLSFSQEENDTQVAAIDVNYMYGVIANHNSNILHLITGHPEGVLVSWNRKTFGKQKWEQRFNYPDVGASFLYQDFKNENLGENYSLYGHFNFYFLKRNIMFRAGQGITYVTNPYDRYSNNRNVAFGSRLLSSTYLMLNYKKERLFKSRFGIQTGVTLTHYSNANIKAPNTSINTISANIGVTYSLGNETKKEYIKREKDSLRVREPIRYNIVFRGGINQGDVIGTKQYPFYIASFYVDKRVGNVSAIQIGADAFFSNFLKEEIEFNSIAYPEKEVDPGTDYKRIGVFIGHELFINKVSLITQFGYYVYYPYEFETRIYERIGVKRYFGDKIFASVTLKAHAAAAEALEFGIGIRL